LRKDSNSSSRIGRKPPPRKREVIDHRGQMSEKPVNSQLTSDLNPASGALSAEPVNPVVVARNLTKIYGNQRAVVGINFTVNRGEAFGLVGPNGAGKSTRMRMVACRAPLTSGALAVEGLDVRIDGRKIRSLIGVVPQENNLDPDLNVHQNLIIYASYFRI